MVGLITRDGFGVSSHKTERLGIKISVNVMLYFDEIVDYISLFFFFLNRHASVEFMC